jgi:phage shock protein A
MRLISDEHLEQMQSDMRKLRAENERLTAYARELQERITTLVNENARLKDLVRTLLENEPDDLIADGGITVLDGWRDSARYLLGKE